MCSAAEIIRRLKGGLIVSCQAPEGSPLNHPRVIAAMAAAAGEQGAAGVRINSPGNIRAARSVVGIPVIGIEKLQRDGSAVYITPTFRSARRVVSAGADIIALDCTPRRRPGGELLEAIIEGLKHATGILIMADVSTVEEGVRAAAMGADLVATTLHGYTGDMDARQKPAFALLRTLARKIAVPVILEGRVHTPDDLRKGFDLGAHAVVVGTAITNIEWRVRTFVEAASCGKPGRL